MVRDPLQTNSSPAGPKWALCAAFVLAMLVPEVAAAQLTLERVVLVSRHGVRAPTNSAALSDYTASQTWPTWPVAADGDLTPRGEELASLMGDYYRRHFAAFGVLPAHGCPAPNQVYVWADVDQRTRHTGNALLAGAFPGCGLYAQHLLPTHQLDPLFHPVGAGVCQIDKERARAEILKAAGGSLEHKLKQQPYSGALKRLQAVLDCCKPKLCKAQGVRCTLEVVPSEIVERGNSVGLSGPISIGSTTTEVFLLEYAQGMPQVAWGRASTPAEFVPLMWLHSLQFELIQRTNHIARRQGSALVYQVVETLRQTAERRPTPGRPAPPDSKLVVYVGHDTNLANIGGMLNVDWRLKSYLPNETPPAGAMAFELLRDMASGQYFVRMAYYSQTPGQMRSVSQLSAALPPDRADILPACRNPRDGACPWSEFAALAMNALDMDCVVATPR